MKLELATQNDFDAIIAFYDDVTERTSEMATYARWSKGKHPTIEGIRAYINEGSMYIYREQGVIVGAMAVTMYQGEDYHAIDYTVQKTRSRSHRLDISIRYTFNAQKSKYKGTGAGKAEQQRMGNN